MSQKMPFMNSIYIDVAVTVPSDTTYTYKVPEEMEALAVTGKRVLVPFAHRRVTGYILGSVSSPDTGKFRIKSVIDILDQAPLFHDSMIPFFKWISEYYMYPLGEVIQCALPGGINIHDTSVASLTGSGENALIDNSVSDKESAILSFLQEGPKSAASALRSQSVPIPAATLNSLQKKGFITLERQLKKATATQKTERFVRSTGLDLPLTNLTRKRTELVTFLREAKELPVKTLKEHFPTAPTFFSFLKSSGHIELFEKPVFRDPFGDAVEPDTPPELTEEQQHTVTTVANAIGNGFSPFLLAGVTGSGKTEVYMQLVSEALNKGRTAIVLVPEIALISQTARRFRGRFGKNIAVIHSGLSKGEKYDQWRLIAEKKVSIVIGARSAIFAPLENTGIIIVDEEHDASYKQENGLKYNARDLAIVRAKQAGCAALLGSATPSIQSWYNAVTGKFSELRLTKRVSDRPMPVIETVDLRRYKDLPGIRSIITPPLEKAIHQALSQKEQVLLFLNRRGYANYPLCATCGEPMKCVSCDVSLTLHQQSNAYRCHMCSYMVASNSKCPTCNSSNIKHLGFGTERIEAAVKSFFPDASVARMDQDTTTRKGSVIKLLKDVRDKKTDILVGTQMIAKGHDFPGITLVGVICADQSLNFPDFRACERTFQLLAQVAGRAGRGDLPGRVVMQTYNPDHFSIIAARHQDFFKFYDTEIAFRESLGYPPFSRMAQVVISGKNRQEVREHAARTGHFLNSLVQSAPRDYTTIGILGPIEAPIPKMADRYRWQLLLKSPGVGQLHTLVNSLVREVHSGLKKTGIRITIDIDPYYMM